MDRFRKNYTPITEGQKALGLAIKEKAEELAALFAKGLSEKTGFTLEEIEAREKMTDAEREYDDRARRLAADGNRCLSAAYKSLEESVMWACKGVYTEK